jgi:hypothetical protein
MSTEEQINALYIYTYQIVEILTDLESEGVLKHDAKAKGKQFLKSLSKISDTIREFAKETDNELYNDGMSKLHLVCKELDAKMIELFEKYK